MVSITDTVERARALGWAAESWEAPNPYSHYAVVDTFPAELRGRLVAAYEEGRLRRAVGALWMWITSSDWLPRVRDAEELAAGERLAGRVHDLICAAQGLAACRPEPGVE